MAQPNAPVKDISPQEMLNNFESALGFKLKYNMLTHRIMVDQSGKTRPFNDGDMAAIHNHARVHAPLLESKAYKNKFAIEMAVESVKRDRPYNPLSEYLNSCLYKYKQQPADYFGDLTSHLEFGDELDVKFLYRWLHGVLGRVKHNYQNDMLILKGRQGVGKSSFFIELMRNMKDMYIDEDVNLYDKDQIIYLGTKLLWVIEEFGSVLKSADRNKVKAFLTKERVEKRQAYARYASNYDRICSHAGTTNDEEFLTDTTGNRRYLVATLIGADLDWLRSDFDPDLLWGQVYFNLCEQGLDVCKLTLEEREAKERVNDQNIFTDPLADFMQQWLDPDPEGVIYASDLSNKLKEVDRGNVGWFRIADLLAAMGARRCRVGHDQRRAYKGLAWKPEHSPPTGKEDNVRFFKPR